MKIYTDDKKALLEQVSLMGNRISALELIGGDTPLDYIIQQEHNAYGKAPTLQTPARTPSPSLVKQRDYEPEI